MPRFPLVIAAFALGAAPAFAGSPDATGPNAPLIAPGQPDARTPALVFTLGLGAGFAPEYFGSDDYRVGPAGSFAFHSLNLGRLSLGDPDPRAERTGFGLRGSFRYIGERDTSEYSELTGLDDIDAAVELGLGVGYTTRNLDAFVVARRGFGGHEGVVGEAGFDVIARPSAALKLTAGPRLFWGNDSYADTYFGVDADEASADLAAFDAQGGLLSAGLEFGASYRIDDNWGLEGALRWDSFANDAEDSPIVRQGSADQWSISFGVTRVIRIGG